MICNELECTHTQRARGLCSTHYNFRRRHGTLPPRRPTLLDLVEAEHESRPDSCWLWPYSQSTGGYGHLGVDGTPAMAHRVMYERRIGAIPEGLELDHLCAVTSCVNPAHLEPVTHAENMRRLRSRRGAA